MKRIFKKSVKAVINFIHQVSFLCNILDRNESFARLSALLFNRLLKNKVFMVFLLMLYAAL